MDCWLEPRANATALFVHLLVRTHMGSLAYVHSCHAFSIKIRNLLSLVISLKTPYASLYSFSSNRTICSQLKTTVQLTLPHLQNQKPKPSFFGIFLRLKSWLYKNLKLAMMEQGWKKVNPSSMCVSFFFSRDLTHTCFHPCEDTRSADRSEEKWGSRIKSWTDGDGVLKVQIHWESARDISKCSIYESERYKDSSFLLTNWC